MLSRPLRWITFDCYGTLIDWETGVRDAFEEVARRLKLRIEPDRLFDRWEAIQFRKIRGPYSKYKDVLRRSMDETLKSLGVRKARSGGDVLVRSLPTWKPFPEVPAALERLQRRYRLGIISNTDEDLLRASVKRMGLRFDVLVTAEAARAYKPSIVPFRLALQRLGVPASQALHVAFGFRYDLIPARLQGFQTVLLNRWCEPIPAGYTADAEVRDLEELATLLSC